jgi:prevent-host-death family protein
MVKFISLKQLRPNLPKTIKDINMKLDRYIVSKRGKPVAVMMSIDDYEGLLETIEILHDKNLVKRLKKAKREIQEGKTISLEELRQKLEKI